MCDPWDNLPIDEEYDSDESILSPLAKHTEMGWRQILRLCHQQASCGFGALDSFLCGADLERRMSLVEKEALINECLRENLRDTTLGLNQSKDWSSEQTKRMRRAAGINAE